MRKSLPILFLILLTAAAVQASQGSFRVGVSPAPPHLTATVDFSEPSGNRMLDAEETAHIHLEVKNRGPGDAFDVTVELRAEKDMTGVTYERETSLGTIPAGQTVSRRIPVTADSRVPSGALRFILQIHEANGFDADPLAVAFETQAFLPPQLAVADVGIADANGNGRIEPLENVEVTVRVQNMGRGSARNVSVEIAPGENVFLGGKAETHFLLGDLNPAEYRDVVFLFYTNRRIADGEKVPIQVKLREERPEYALARSLDFVMNAPTRQTREVVVRGERAPESPITPATGLSVDIETHIPKGTGAGPWDIAVVIGNRRYQHVSEVQFADRGARIVREYLQTTLGFDAQNILYEENAGLSKFNEIFGREGNPRGRLFNWVKPGESHVFIYYAGHGAPDLNSGDAYFVPVDADPQYLAGSGYRLQTLYDNLSRLPAKSLSIVIDACFSGNSGDGAFLFQGVSPALVRVKGAYRAPVNAVLMTSAAVDQVSAWYPEKNHSLFTYYFLKGLQGDADANGDRVVTVGEMKRYLSEHVPYMARRLKGVEQHPVVTGDESRALVRLE